MKFNTKFPFDTALNCSVSPVCVINKDIFDLKETMFKKRGSLGLFFSLFGPVEIKRYICLYRLPKVRENPREL